MPSIPPQKNTDMIEQLISPSLALLSSEQNSIFEHMSEAVEILSSDACYLYVNPSWKRLFGFTSQDIFQKNPSQLICPKGTEPQLYQEAYQVASQGKAWKGELQAQAKDGRIISLSCKIFPLQLPGKKQPYIVALKQDQTGSKAKDIELLRFTAAAEHAVDAIEITNLQVEYVYVNPAWEKLTGYSAQEAIGKTPAQLLRSQEHPKAYLEKVVTDVMSGKVWHGEIISRNKSGSLIAQDTVVSPVYDKHGKLSHLLCIKRNINQKKKDDEAFQLLATALENMGDAVEILSSELVYEYLNPAWETITGFSHTECIGKSPKGVLCAEEYEERWDTIQKALMKGETWNEEFTMLRKDGSTCYLDTALSPILDDKGQLKHIVSIKRDLTKRKELEKEIRKLEKQVQQAQKWESLGILAGGIAHDFNNLLTGVLGNASLLLRETALSVSGFESVQQIEMAAKRAAELCRQMLVYSGKAEFAISQVDLNGELKKAISLLKTSFPEHIHIKMDLASELPQIDADSKQLQQVLMNLLINASEAVHHAQGEITITTKLVRFTHHENDRVYFSESNSSKYLVSLEVADNGHGMDIETQRRIFDPFFTTKFTGRGLGLSVVLGIIRSHQGALRVQSKVDRGTTFQILFPPGQYETNPQQKEEKQMQIREGKGCVLFVDDEEILRNLGRRMLRRMGFEVLMASNGQEALEVFQENQEKITLVILDQNMPKMNGKIAFQKIREINQEIKVLLVSGHDQEGILEPELKEQLTGFIRKPYQFTSFQQHIFDALDS